MDPRARPIDLAPFIADMIDDLYELSGKGASELRYHLRTSGENHIEIPVFEETDADNSFSKPVKSKNENGGENEMTFEEIMDEQTRENLNGVAEVLRRESVAKDEIGDAVEGVIDYISDVEAGLADMEAERDAYRDAVNRLSEASQTYLDGDADELGDLTHALREVAAYTPDVTFYSPDFDDELSEIEAVVDRRYGETTEE